MAFPDGKKLQFQARLGDRVREEREGAGLSLGQLSQRTGIAKVTLERIEHGLIPCPLYTATLIADELDCTLDDLVPVQVDA